MKIISKITSCVDFRAITHITGFVLRPSPDSGCLLNYVAQCDPQGKLPPWLVNKGIVKTYSCPIHKCIVTLNSSYPYSDSYFGPSDD